MGKKENTNENAFEYFCTIIEIRIMEFEMNIVWNVFIGLNLNYNKSIKIIMMLRGFYIFSQRHKRSMPKYAETHVYNHVLAQMHLSMPENVPLQHADEYKRNNVKLVGA